MTTYSGSCHCGLARFEVTADIDHVRVCDCSICRRRGALLHRVAKENLRILTPLSKLTVYRWGSMTGADYFCPVCGILPFRKPSSPTAEELAQGVPPFDGWSVNTRCLEDFDLASVEQRNVYGSRLVLPHQPEDAMENERNRGSAS